MTAYGLCFLATELVGLAIASVPVYCHIPSGSFVRTVSVGAIVAAVPAAIFSVIMAAITGWLCEQKKHKVLGYLGALMLVSAVFLACVPRRLYFHVPRIPDYRRMTAEHYLLWLSALGAGIVGTWALNRYWETAKALSTITHEDA